MAYDLLESIGNDLVLATLARIGAYQLAAEGYKDLKPNDLIPQWKPKHAAPRPEDRPLSPNQQAALFSMAMAGRN